MGSVLGLGTVVLIHEVRCLGPLGMPWPQTGATLYLAQIGLTDKGRAIKGLIVGSVVWLGSMIYGMGLWTSGKCMVWSHVVVRMAIELNYRNTT